MLSIIFSISFLFSYGYTISRPHPKTAMVLPFTSRAPIWAKESTPLAMPLTTVIPHSASSRDISSPYPVHRTSLFLNQPQPDIFLLLNGSLHIKNQRRIIYVFKVRRIQFIFQCNNLDIIFVDIFKMPLNVLLEFLHC